MISYIIQQAISENHLIEIIYFSEKGISERVIRPIKLESEYVEAYCYKRNAIRKFKIANILSGKIIYSRKVG